jgi:predicted metal-dependent hydrolase
MTEVAWPPQFTLRKSGRAKRASIRINLKREIEVVVPEKSRFFNPHHLLDAHKDWIVKHLSVVPQIPEPVVFSVPEQIVFPGLDQVYQVRLNPDESKRLSLRREKNLIILSGDLSCLKKTRLKLIDWLNKEAGLLLWPQVLFLCDKHGFEISELRIRFMKTRWGTCNRVGKITLNAQLVFLPLSLIHHVILHELCHTRYMNHGPRFWALLTKLDPQTEVHNKSLRDCQGFMPDWLK